MKKSYNAPQIHTLGSAVKLTKGSYPHTPEKNGTTDKAVTRAPVRKSSNPH